jgi:hypothetical protein
MFDLQQYRLRQEHAWLEREIRAEQRRPYPDSLKLQAMKRRKLAVKERLHAVAAPNYAFA